MGIGGELGRGADVGVGGGVVRVVVYKKVSVNRILRDQ